MDKSVCTRDALEPFGPIDFVYDAHSKLHNQCANLTKYYNIPHNFQKKNHKNDDFY